LLFGSGEGPLPPVAAKTVRAWFPERKLSTAIGAATSANPVAGAIGTPIVIGLIAAFDSWRAPFIALGVVGVLSAIGCWVTVRDHPSQHPWSSLAEIEEMAEEDHIVAARFETASGAALDPITVQVAPPAHHQSRTHRLCLKLVDAPSPSGDSTSLASCKT
jgi:MFS family permease